MRHGSTISPFSDSNLIQTTYLQIFIKMAETCGNSKSDCLPQLKLSKGVGKIDNNSIQTWNLLQEDLSLPAAVLDMEKVTHNLAWMEEFLTKFKAPIQLAPHGKTSMMPKLFRLIQSKSTSNWGMTLATASQVKVAHSFGVSKILMANQLVGKRNMEIISEIMGDEKNFDFLCIIDSPQNVNQLGQFFKERKQKLKVLLEYGPSITDGSANRGRTGTRNEDQEAKLLSSLHDWTGTLELVGVEFFEGVLSQEAQVSEFLDFIIKRTTHLIKSQAFSQQNNDASSSSSPIIISGSGSVWFDLVAEKLTSFYESYNSPAAANSNPLQIILRPGCYMIHDVGMYKEIQGRIEAKGLMTSELRPSLKIWAYVQSLPENGVAIVGFGRRDAGNDTGFPKPAWHFRPTAEIKPNMNVAKDWELFRMMDQHSFMRIKEDGGDELQVGDVVLFDIIHACTTLDKWRHVVVMDNERDMKVVDVYPTFF